jgi:DNA polymerase-3 subunit epsilon
MLDQNNFTIVDVETTGGSPFFNRVIEIGLLRVEKGEVVEEYKQLFNPGMALPEFISEMTGITDTMLARAPRFEDLAEEILGKFEDAIFVAHNSQFDYGFLKEEFRRVGLAFNLPQLCAVRVIFLSSCIHTRTASAHFSLVTPARIKKYPVSTYVSAPAFM